jgi:excisionase family DNA binding protein
MRRILRETIASRKRFLNVDEAAQYLETTRRNIYRLAEQNKLAHHRIARRLQDRKAASVHGKRS